MIKRSVVTGLQRREAEEPFGSAELLVFARNSVRFSTQLVDALPVQLHRASSLLRRYVSRWLRQLTVLRVLQPELSKYIRLDGVDPCPPDRNRRLRRIERVVRVRRRTGGPVQRTGGLVRLTGGRIVKGAAAAAERRDQSTDGPGKDRVDVGTHDVRQRRRGRRRQTELTIIDYTNSLTHWQLDPSPRHCK